MWNSEDGENKNASEVTINMPDGPVTFKTLEKDKSLRSGGTLIRKSSEEDPVSNRLSGRNDLSDGKDNMNSLPDQGNSKTL